MLNKNEIKPIAVPAEWRQENGVIYPPPVVSYGITGRDLWMWYSNKSIEVTRAAQDVLRSSNFVPMKGKYQPAILPVSSVKPGQRENFYLNGLAEELKLLPAKPEIICLMGMQLMGTLKKMGNVSFVGMHPPIKDSEGDPMVLAISNDIKRGLSLSGIAGTGRIKWQVDTGCVYMLPDPEPTPCNEV